MRNCRFSASLKFTFSHFPKGHQSLDELATEPKSPDPLPSSGYLNTITQQIHCPEAQVRFCSVCVSIWNTYCHEQFLHTVRGHTVQMGQMKLEMHFVAEDILAEGAADNRLHWMLRQDMHLDTIWVPTIVVTVRTLIELKKIKLRCRLLVSVLFITCWYCYLNSISPLFPSWVIWKSSRMQLNYYIFFYLLMTKFIVLWRLWFFSCTILFFCQKKLLCPYHSVHFWFLLWCDYSCSENIIFKNIF